MFLHRLVLGAAGAVFALALGASAAVAASAYASSTVNVRAGDGTGYPVVDVLRPGQRVEVEYCRGSWCMISKSGPDGWVSASYLTRDRYDGGDYRYGGGGYRYDDDFYIERPRNWYRPHRPYRPYYGSEFCWGGRNASVCFGD